MTAELLGLIRARYPITKKLVAVLVALACAAAQHSSAQTVADWQKRAVAK